MVNADDVLSDYIIYKDTYQIAVMPEMMEEIRRKGMKKMLVNVDKADVVKEDKKKAEEVCERYKSCLDQGKTERECVALCAPRMFIPSDNGLRPI